jgi:hypothetical protein
MQAGGRNKGVFVTLQRGFGFRQVKDGICLDDRHADGYRLFPVARQATALNGAP